SHDRADDLAQETLVRLWRKAAQYDPSRASASAWVYAIARNVRVDAARRDGRAVPWIEDEGIDLDEPERQLLAAEREALVRSMIVSLPEEQLRAIRMCFFRSERRR